MAKDRGPKAPLASKETADAIRDELRRTAITAWSDPKPGGIVADIRKAEEAIRAARVPRPDRIDHERRSEHWTVCGTCLTPGSEGLMIYDPRTTVCSHCRAPWKPHTAVFPLGTKPRPSHFGESISASGSSGGVSGGSAGWVAPMTYPVSDRTISPYITPPGGEAVATPAPPKPDKRTFVFNEVSLSGHSVPANVRVAAMHLAGRYLRDFIVTPRWKDAPPVAGETWDEKVFAALWRFFALQLLAEE